jgi:hypothetical protein
MTARVHGPNIKKGRYLLVTELLMRIFVRRKADVSPIICCPSIFKIVVVMESVRMGRLVM